MLVLTRKVGEEIFLDYNGMRIVVKVLKIHGRAAKLGIGAPREVAIHRMGSPDCPAEPSHAGRADQPPNTGIRRTFHRLFNPNADARLHR